MLMLMLYLWLQAEIPGVTHFGAYHRPPDGHFVTNFTGTTSQIAALVKIHSIQRDKSQNRMKEDNYEKNYLSS